MQARDGGATTLPRKPRAQDQSVTFRFVQSQFNRVIRVDGVWGGLIPDGLHMAVFSQHHPVPSEVSYQLNPSSSSGLGPEIGRKQEPGLVRTVEAELMINLDTARAIRDWMTSRIEQLEQMQREEDGAD